jgi:hypothetical protein
MSSNQEDPRTIQSSFPRVLESQVLERMDTHEHLRLGWRILLTMLLLACIAILGLVAASRTQVEASSLRAPLENVALRPQGQGSSDPLVMAFYYTWFDENTWNYDKLSDLPAQPYVSRDRAVMGRHIDQAKAAGIDAFLVAWIGPSGQFNQTEPNLTALLEEAAARNFKIGILFETDSPFLKSEANVAGALQHTQSTHLQHPAYLRIDGRPVVFFWRPTLYDVDTWRNIRSQVDPGNGQIWISEGVDMSYLSVFDGHHLYSNTWSPPSDLSYTNQKFANYVAVAASQQGTPKFWVATVMPGYNDLRIRPGGGFAQDREGGAYYARAWQAAIDSRPNWIVINSFNEWPEGTYIEPSVAYGSQFIDLSAQLSAQFRAGATNRPSEQSAAADPIEVETAQSEPAAILVPTATPFSEPDVPTAYVEASLLNVRAGPGTEHEIVGVVANGVALPIRGSLSDNPEWWLIEFEGQLAWVYAPLITALGPLDQVASAQLSEAHEDSYPSQDAQSQDDLPRYELPFASERNTIVVVPTQGSYP